MRTKTEPDPVSNPIPYSSSTKGGVLSRFLPFPVRCLILREVKTISPPDGFFFRTMDKTEKQALQATKEIVVKFIEIGRISPNNFDQFFSSIYHEVLRTIRSGCDSQPGSAATIADGDAPEE